MKFFANIVKLVKIVIFSWHFYDISYWKSLYRCSYIQEFMKAGLSKALYGTKNCISSRRGCPYSKEKSLFKSIYSINPVGLTWVNISQRLVTYHIGTGSTYFSGVYLQTTKDPKLKLNIRRSNNKFFSVTCSRHLLAPTLSLQKNAAKASAHTFISVVVSVMRF